MSAYAPDKAGTIVPFAPTPKGQQDTAAVVDDSGRTIVALLQKAADMANEDCKRAMDPLISFRFNFAHPKND